MDGLNNRDEFNKLSQPKDDIIDKEHPNEGRLYIHFTVKEFLAMSPIEQFEKLNGHGVNGDSDIYILLDAADGIEIW